MKIAVIAANGRSGQAFVERALAVGHEIHAGVRGTSQLPSHPNLTVMHCDATKAEDIRHLLAGCEAVVSLIGHVHGSPRRVQTQAINNVIVGMREAGIRRVVSLTGTGVRFPGDKLSLIDLFFNVGARFLPIPRIHDGIAHAKALQQSGLDWTVIRVLKLTNRKPRPFSLLAHGPTRFFASRQEVAAAIVSVLEQRSFIGEAPVIGSSR